MGKLVNAAVIALALVGGVAAGAVGVEASVGHSSKPHAQTRTAAAVYPTDSRGLTYGSGLKASSINDFPDLVQVIATNGKTGYVYRSQLLPQSQPSSPAQALAEQQRRSTEHQAAPDIPVYTSDGRTVIGSFALVG